MMVKIIVYISTFVTLLLSCKSEKRIGVFLFEEGNISVNENDILLSREKNPSLLRDTLVLRFLSEYLNDTIVVMGNGTPDTYYYNVRSDMSTAYALSIPVSIKNNKLKELIVLIRGLRYHIPINREYFFLDLYIDSRNVLTGSYNNKILRLS